jgi:hypothetical protein
MLDKNHHSSSRSQKFNRTKGVCETVCFSVRVWFACTSVFVFKKQKKKKKHFLADFHLTARRWAHINTWPVHSGENCCAYTITIACARMKTTFHAHQREREKMFLFLLLLPLSVAVAFLLGAERNEKLCRPPTTACILSRLPYTQHTAHTSHQTCNTAAHFFSFAHCLQLPLPICTARTT